MSVTDTTQGAPPVGYMLHTGASVVIAHHLRPAGTGYLSSGIVLACRDAEPHPYVVWEYAIKGGHYDLSTGDYCLTLAAALVKFEERSGREVMLPEYKRTEE